MLKGLLVLRGCVCWVWFVVSFPWFPSTPPKRKIEMPVCSPIASLSGPFLSLISSHVHSLDDSFLPSPNECDVRNGGLPCPQNSAPDLCASICERASEIPFGAVHFLADRQLHVYCFHLLKVLGLARDVSYVGRIVNDYEPLFFRSSALATLAALTRGARVASGSAVCMKAC
jgi:hypothetical protein